MTYPRRLEPSSCSPRKTYTAIVQTSTGRHQRILRRVGGSKPWVYEVSPEEGSTRRALDSDVFEVTEIDPGVNDHLRRALAEVDRLTDALASTRCPHCESTGMTTERVREIARQEISSALSRAQP